MINQVALVGRIAKDLEITETESGKKVLTLELEVPRTYKNADGIYERDFIECQLFNMTAQTTAKYCRVGDMVGVKGRVQTKLIEAEDGTKKKKTEIVAEKVTFLATRKDDSNGTL